MGFADSIAASISKFNNLINSQVSQTNFNNNINTQNSNQVNNTSNQQSIDPSLDSALSGLSGLLVSRNTPTSTVSQVDQTTYIVNKLVASGADLTKINNLLNAVSGDTDDIAYTRTGPNDPNITLQNRNKVFGLDVLPLLSQASKIAQRGLDLNRYIEAATNVANEGDYDDMRRFISVTDTAIYATNNDKAELNKFFDFSDEILGKRHYDLESNIFDVQTMIGYGATLDTAIKIMKNMENTGLEGRNNMVDLNRVIIDAKNKKLFMPYVFEQMAKSGDTRGFLDNYMQATNMKTTAPDFTKFQRIERIDGEDMVIHQGDSAALFAQAVSSVQGLLPESSLYWSSLQTGAVSNGSSYLDLSKLGPGTYDFYVKVGPGYGGTDTAMKRVVILPKDEISDPVVIKNNGKLKITVEKGSAGLDSDLYMQVNGGNPSLVTNDAQTNTGFTLEQAFKDGDQFDFFIRTHGDPMGLGTYDHGTTTDASASGKYYYQKEQLDENSWRIRFEDLPEGAADFDYDDVVIKVELIKDETKAAAQSAPAQTFNNTPFVPPTTQQTGQASANDPNYDYSLDLEKMEELYKLLNFKVSANDIYKLLDNNRCDKEQVTSFLNDNGQEALAKKNQKKPLQWFDMLVAYGKDQEFYQKSVHEFRQYVDKEEARKFFEHKRLSNSESERAIDLLGFNTDDNVSANNQVNVNVTNQVNINIDINVQPDRK